MEYRLLGRSGLKVSTITMGTMTYATNAPGATRARPAIHASSASHTPARIAACRFQRASNTATAGPLLLAPTPEGIDISAKQILPSSPRGRRENSRE